MAPLLTTRPATPRPQQSRVGIAYVCSLTGLGSKSSWCTMLLFRSDSFGGIHELLPCGLLGGDLVELFRKNKSKYYWYDFMVRGERYRGSTKETNETRAQKAAALKLAATIRGSDPLDRKPPTLREYSKDFLQWVETGRLEADSRRYYRNGWRLLEQTKIAGMRMDQITKDEVEKLELPQ